jgi:nitroreductase
MSEPNLIAWDGFQAFSEQEMEKRSQDLYRSMARRRSVRSFSVRPIPSAVIETCLATARTAPSGANQQPWHFAVVEHAAIKTRIRQAAEACERAFYEKIHGTAWSEALAPLGTHSDKPFLTQAPFLIVVFAQREHTDNQGTVHRHYYVTESVGIALGLLITAIHQAGLATLVYTPAPPTFLNEILDRPDSERAVCILPVGYPAPDALVPRLERKSVDETVTWF